MDPVSLAASLVTVIGAASQISKALRSLYKLRYAQEEILELMNEVTEQSVRSNLANANIGQ